MTGPKHLWSGDWERESTHKPADPTPDTEPAAPAPDQPPGRRRLSPRQLRFSAAGVVAALVIAGAAIAVTSIGGSNSDHSAQVSPPYPFPVPQTRSTPTTPVTPVVPGSPYTPTTPHTQTAPSTPTTPQTQTTPTTPTNPTTPTTSSNPSTVPAVALDPVSWLGMEVVTVGQGQAVIETVAPDSAGDKAGLEPGDQIVDLAGHAIAKSTALAGALQGHHAGDQVTITVQRGTTTLNLLVTLGSPPTNSP